MGGSPKAPRVPSSGARTGRSRTRLLYVHALQPRESAGADQELGDQPINLCEDWVAIYQDGSDDWLAEYRGPCTHLRGLGRKAEAPGRLSKTLG